MRPPLRGVQERLTAQLEEAHRQAVTEMPRGEVVDLPRREGSAER